MALTLVHKRMMAGTDVSVKDFGAVGDGVTNDSTAIQAAIDAVQTNGGSVYFPSATYICSALEVDGGVRLYGDGNATLKRPNEDATGNKIIWALRTNVPSPAAVLDTNPVIFENLIFDGNYDNQSQAGTYALGGQSLIAFKGNATNAATDYGYMVGMVSNCSFINGTSDGIDIKNDAKVTISNCNFRRCWRGGITVTGGRSIITASSCIIDGSDFNTGIDVEPLTVGSLSRQEIEVSLSDIRVDGGLDINVRAGGHATLNNIIVDGGPYNLVCYETTAEPDSSLIASNCRFIAFDNNTISSRINCEGGRILLDNCVFDMKTGSGGAATNDNCANVYFGGASSTFDGGEVRFSDCRFYSSSTQPITGVYATQSQANAKLFVTDCYFDASLRDAIRSENFLNYYKDNIFYNSRYAYTLNGYAATDTETYIDGGIYECTRFANFEADYSTMKLYFTNVMHDQSLNNLDNLSATSPNPVSWGHRTIIATGTFAGANTAGFVGDRVVLQTATAGNPVEYVCVTAGDDTNAVWKVLTTAAV